MRNAKQKGAVAAGAAEALATQARVGSFGSSEGGAACLPGQEGSTGSTSRRVSTQEVTQVQNLIERCMQQYIPQSQVVSLLQQQAKIEPSFTTLVWQKLEEQNSEFFKLYYIRLKLKEQIVMFNYLLEQQVRQQGARAVQPPLRSFDFLFVCRPAPLACRSTWSRSSMAPGCSPSRT
jgi:uncharacterized protein (TIGR01589 family)